MSSPRRAFNREDYYCGTKADFLSSAAFQAEILTSQEANTNLSGHAKKPRSCALQTLLC